MSGLSFCALNFSRGGHPPVFQGRGHPPVFQGGDTPQFSRGGHTPVFQGGDTPQFSREWDVTPSSATILVRQFKLSRTGKTMFTRLNYVISVCLFVWISDRNSSTLDRFASNFDRGSLEEPRECSLFDFEIRNVSKF